MVNVVNRDTFDIFDGRLHFVEDETRNTFRKFPTSVNTGAIVCLRFEPAS